MSEHRYRIDVNSVRRAFPPGIEPPALLMEFAAWLNDRPWGSVGCFDLVGCFAEIAPIVDGGPLRDNFALFGRLPDGSIFGAWNPVGCDMSAAPIVVLGSEGQHEIIAASFEGLLAKIALQRFEEDGEWTDFTPHEDVDDETDELADWLSARVAAKRLEQLAETPDDLSDFSRWVGKWCVDREAFWAAHPIMLQIADALKAHRPEGKNPWDRTHFEVSLAGGQFQIRVLRRGRQPVAEADVIEPLLRELRDTMWHEQSSLGLWYSGDRPAVERKLWHRRAVQSDRPRHHPFDPSWKIPVHVANFLSREFPWRSCCRQMVGYFRDSTTRRVRRSTKSPPILRRPGRTSSARRVPQSGCRRGSRLPEAAVMERLQFQRLADVPTLPGYSLVTRSIANDQTLLFLFVEDRGLEAIREAYRRGTASFPAVRREIASRWRLVKSARGSSQVIDLGVLDVTSPHVDIFPDGRVLVAEPTCCWRSPDDYDLNGAVFDPRHERSTRMLLGDGIGNIRVDALGRIWAGYTDEGIFGNYGWGGPSGPRPVGAAGLVCFSDTGEKFWEYPDNADYQMSECYALNVSGAEATAFFYDEFPLCRVSSDLALRHWKTELLDCHVLAVSETEVLFSGQYDDLSHIGYRCTLAVDRIEEVRQTTFVLPDGSPLGEGTLRARGKCLYYFDDTCAYRAGLD